MLRDFRVIRAGLSPIAQRAGTHQRHVTGLQVDLLRRKRSPEFLRSDGEVGGKRLDSLPRGHINQHGARDDRWDSIGVGFANAKIAAVVLLAKAVVPVIISPRGNVSQSIDLGTNIVGNEQFATVKSYLFFAISEGLNII